MKRIDIVVRVGCTFWTAFVNGATVPMIFHPDLPFEEVARALAHHNPEADVHVTDDATGDVIAVLRARTERRPQDRWTGLGPRKIERP